MSVEQRGSLIYGKLETALVLDGLTEELNLADLALSEAVLMLISPFHKCELHRFIAVNSDKVTILIFITKSHRPIADGAIGKTSKFGINPVSQGAEQDVAGYNKCYIIIIKVDFRFELSWHNWLLGSLCIWFKSARSG